MQKRKLKGFQRTVSVRDKNLGHLTQKSMTLSSSLPFWGHPAKDIQAGSARLGSSWPFSLLTEGMVSKIVIERDDLELKAEALVRAVG